MYKKHKMYLLPNCWGMRKKTLFMAMLLHLVDYFPIGNRKHARSWFYFPHPGVWLHIHFLIFNIHSHIVLSLNLIKFNIKYAYYTNHLSFTAHSFKTGPYLAVLTHSGPRSVFITPSSHSVLRLNKHNSRGMDAGLRAKNHHNHLLMMMCVMTKAKMKIVRKDSDRMNM